MLITPSNITELKANEVFVFGSNREGQHAGGAARIAHDKFGAVWGVGVGPTGSCYAIPTMTKDLEQIRVDVQDFIMHAIKHPDKVYLVTEIGCGIAGHNPNQIAPMFSDALYSNNIKLPASFIDIIINL